MSKEQFHFHKRNGIYPIRFQRFGKRISRSLKTGNLAAAQGRARAMVAAAEMDHFTALDPAARRELASLADVVNVFKAAAEARGIKKSTVRDYLNSLKLVVESGGFDLQTASSAVLTRDLVDGYVKGRLKVFGDARGRRSLKSTIRQARAVFSGWALEEYRNRLNVPDLRDFLAAGRVKAPPVQYEIPPADLVALTLAAGRALRADKPDLYAVFLCCYDLALRAGEAVALRWDWFRKDASGITLDVIRRDDFTPKGKNRSIPVATEVWKHLQRLKNGDFVIPGRNKTERTRLIKREFAGWMRGIGWDGDRWPKAAHELRKLQGSRWYTELGAEVAQHWLGHSDISTTCRYYAALTRQPKPLPMN